MIWLESIQNLAQEKTAFAIVTVTKVKGHSPRGAGAKMLVTETETFDTVGGGMLEQTAIIEARKLIKNPNQNVKELIIPLNIIGTKYGVQCCGGEVSLLIETVNAKRPKVVIFGAGYVAQALVKTLSILDIDIELIDSRQNMLADVSMSGQAKLTKTYSAIPATKVKQLDEQSIVYIMTHDHAQDFAIATECLKQNFKFLGLIGSSVKWIDFQKKLSEQGFSKKEIARITCPIGLANVKGKTPAAIAISTAGQIINLLEDSTIEAPKLQ